MQAACGKIMHETFKLKTESNWQPVQQNQRHKERVFRAEWTAYFTMRSVAERKIAKFGICLLIQINNGALRSSVYNDSF